VYERGFVWEPPYYPHTSLPLSPCATDWTQLSPAKTRESDPPGVMEASVVHVSVGPHSFQISISLSPLRALPRCVNTIRTFRAVTGRKVTVLTVPPAGRAGLFF
jgi:hypothetical protein